tara:strand:+ start:274 stop:459 length:186 start_codon:yes stop_codon:yes gene_type:complete
MEELYIKAIKGAILKMKNPNTTEDERTEAMRTAGRNLGKLKHVNNGMHEDLQKQYIDCLPV